ncbi:MAG TPA: nuclear transport factor 2 family protein [Lactobacillaceae bacterium]|jgi:ketosteroid isomerase-like protein
MQSVVEAYLTAHNQGNFDALPAIFTDHAIVVDEGQRYQGLLEIAQWMRKTLDAYQMTSELLAFDGEIIKVKVTGNFPGSPAVMTHHVTFFDDKIQSLEM